MSENKHRASRENAGRLWRRGSRSPSSKIIVEKELMDKVERKLQEKRLAAAENASLQASERSVRANRSSDTTHPAYRSRRELMNSELNASIHILTAMRPSSLTPSSRTSSSTTKVRRSNTLTNSLQHRSIKAQTPGITRAYNPSPLQNLSRIPSTTMNVNKNLPPLPPERQIMLRHAASRASLKDVVGVRKLAVKRVISKYVGEMAMAY
jgi:hypothetical protein